MGKVTILLADDHKMFREGTRSLLEREEDMQVVGEAGDGEEAVRLVEQLKPDVIVLDIAMPKLNGIEATRKIKALRPTTIVLILTAYDNDPYVFALLEAGAAGYLLKDIAAQQLVEAIRAVSAGEAMLHPAVARKVLNYFISSAGKLQKEVSSSVLSERELEVLRLAAKGMCNKEIATELTLSVRTIQSHLSNIFTRLNVGSRTEAVLLALKKGWFPMEDIMEAERRDSQ